MTANNERIPRRTTRAITTDVRALPLEPKDGFLLTRVDGTLTVEDLLFVTGMPLASLDASLSKLENLDLITFEPEPREIGTSQAPGQTLSRSPAPSPSAKPANAEAAAAADSEAIDLDPEQQQAIRDLYARSEGGSHYSILGVEPTADKKAIKRAYFDLAAKYHPDRFFRKQLGPFKVQIEAVFSRATFAHDVLTDKEQRKEYDAYLGDIAQARSIEALMRDALAEVQRVEEQVQQSIPASSPPAPNSRAVSDSPPRSTRSGSDKPDPGKAIKSAPPIDANKRREMLARKLLGRAPVRSAPSSPPPSMPQKNAEATAAAMETLKRRYEERLSRAKEAQARRYLADAEQAMRNGDVVAGANALRVASTLLPTNSELLVRYQDTQKAADAVLSETYVRQASYEEKSEHWVDAARSWRRVAEARPEDAHAHERAANALVKAGGNLHEANRYAQRAVALDPKNAHHRVTLSTVYLGAGLALNAKRELETALQLSPEDVTIQGLLKWIQKTGSDAR